MPGSAQRHPDPPQIPAQDRRWEQDLIAIREHVDLLVRSWPRITPEQRARLEVLLTEDQQDV